MKFCLIDTVARTALVEDHIDLDSAVSAVGVDPHKTDHGMVSRSRGVVVYEFGLFEDAASQHYFTAGGRLYAGNGVLYDIGPAGETVDFVGPHGVQFLDHIGVEREIEAGRIVRPTMSVNGEVFWRWPDPSGHPEGA